MRAHSLLTQNQIKDLEPYFNWMEILHPQSRDSISIRCRICYRYRIENNLCVSDSGTHKERPLREECSTLTALVREGGFRDNKNFKVAAKIKEHAKMSSHLNSVKYFNDKFEKTVEGQFLESDKKDPTCCNLRTVYEEQKSNIAFNRHSHIVNLEEANGVDCGTLHKSRWSAREMTISMSQTLHKKLLPLVKDRDARLSIILDNSTDSLGRNYLLVYFRIYYRFYPHVFLYKVILLESETAQAMFDKIVDEFKLDSIDEIIPKKLVALGTDGASVMTGEHNGLRALFRRYAGNMEMPGIHCMAHKLELVVKHTFDNVKPRVVFGDKEFEIDLRELLTDAVNGISSHFGGKAVKRRTTMNHICKDELKMKTVYELQKLVDMFKDKRRIKK